jgi:hypothetical protein
MTNERRASGSSAKGDPEMSNVEALFLNVPEFCEAARIGKRTFYSLKSQGKAPTITKVGDRNLIAIKDAHVWQEKMRAQTIMAAEDAA